MVEQKVLEEQDSPVGNMGNPVNQIQDNPIVVHNPIAVHTPHTPHTPHTHDDDVHDRDPSQNQSQSRNDSDPDSDSNFDPGQNVCSIWGFGLQYRNGLELIG